jgi:hypothetical protein
MTTETFPINVGPLSGLDSLSYYTSEPLNRYSDLYQRGARPEVEWDLRQVQSGRMNLAGLTAFLSLAHRLRQFTLEPPYLRLTHDEKAISFLKDISFLQLAKKYDLWRVADPLRAVAKRGKTNPNTNIFMFELSEFPDPEDSDFIPWKDYIRQEIKKELLLKCGPIFKPRADTVPLPEALPDEIAIVCAELVLNSVLHGRSPAFIGLQRTYPRISVAVCDSGRGFLQTLQDRHERLGTEIPFANTHLKAVLLGCLVNRRGYGLRRAIDTVIRSGGWVEISSGECQINWRAPLWDHVVRAAANDASVLMDTGKMLGPSTTGKPSPTETALGFYRVSEYGLRGARVTFEIPIRQL